MHEEQQWSAELDGRGKGRRVRTSRTVAFQHRISLASRLSPLPLSLLPDALTSHTGSITTLSLRTSKNPNSFECLLHIGMMMVGQEGIVFLPVRRTVNQSNPPCLSVALCCIACSPPDLAEKDDCGCFPKIQRTWLGSVHSEPR